MQMNITARNWRTLGGVQNWHIYVHFTRVAFLGGNQFFNAAEDLLERGHGRWGLRWKRGEVR